jgi:hypothetical protein
MTVTVAKMNNRIVEVIRVAETVGFSTERGWVCVCPHVGDVDSNAVRWVRLRDQRFEWIRKFSFTNEIA